MPSLSRILGFVVMATLTVVVGNYVYGRFVAPFVGNLFKKAA